MAGRPTTPAQQVIAATNHAWLSWTNNSTNCYTNASYTKGWIVWNTQVELTAEQKNAEADRLALCNKAEAERRAARARADERAELLLISLLDESQKEMLKREHRFLVECNSGRIYEIKRGRAHNIKVLGPDKKTQLEELCVHVQGAIPDADNMVAQLLHLKVAEVDLRRQANIWDLTKPTRPVIHRSMPLERAA